MWNLSTLIPILISCAMLAIALWTYKNSRQRESKTDHAEERTEMIQGEAKFRSDVLEQLRVAQADNTKLRTDLWDCQNARLQLQANADELARLKSENAILKGLLNKT